jgi:hypothetical protein
VATFVAHQEENSLEVNKKQGTVRPPEARCVFWKEDEHEKAARLLAKRVKEDLLDEDDYDNADILNILEELADLDALMRFTDKRCEIAFRSRPAATPWIDLDLTPPLADNHALRSADEARRAEVTGGHGLYSGDLAAHIAESEA